MQDVHRLKPHKSQRDRLSLLYLLFCELNYLRRLWLLCILDLLKSERRAIYEEFDELWALRDVLRIRSEDEAAGTNSLVEL